MARIGSYSTMRMVVLEVRQMTRNNSDWQTSCAACGASCHHYGSGRPRKYCSRKCNLSVNRPIQIKKNKTGMPRKYKQWSYEWVRSCKLARGNCLDCGRAQDQRTTKAFDWDHRDPMIKCFDLTAIPKNTSRQMVLDEMEKCDVLCAFCHRLRPTSFGGTSRYRNRTHRQLDLGGLFGAA